MDVRGEWFEGRASETRDADKKLEKCFPSSAAVTAILWVLRLRSGTETID